MDTEGKGIRQLEECGGSGRQGDGPSGGCPHKLDASESPKTSIEFLDSAMPAYVS